MEAAQDKEVEESKLSPDLVEKIEKLGLDPFDKVSLLAIAAGLKPSTFFAFEATTYPPVIKKIESFLEGEGSSFKFKVVKNRQARPGWYLASGFKTYRYLNSQ